MSAVVAVLNARKKHKLENEVVALKNSKSFSKRILLSSKSWKARNAVTPVNTMEDIPVVIEEVEIKRENCWNQEWVRHKYESNFIQIAVAVLIFANFIVSAIEKVVLPQEGSPEQFVFLIFEWFFGLIFTVELAWNMYGSWWSLFWQSGWNWFDFIIVLISLLSLGLGNLPGISVLRLFRAFRVFRLFKRVPSLKLIIEGVVASLPGVSNAFVVLGILMGIWSIMGVEFFKKYDEQSFGDFFKAMFTMWQIMTMDSWASGIARPLIYDHGQIIAGPIFFISFTFIAGIIMTNVVVAILLEKYLECTSKAAEAKAEAKAKKAAEKDGKKHHGPPKEKAATQGSRNPKMKGANKAKEEKAAKEALAAMQAAAPLPSNVHVDGEQLAAVLKQISVLSSQLKSIGAEVRDIKKRQQEYQNDNGMEDLHL